jgi:hypothetical protein
MTTASTPRRAVKLRDRIFATAKLLVEFGDVLEDRIASIHSGSGHVEMASAIEQLGLLLEEIWDRVESRISVTAEMVERAPRLALELTRCSVRRRSDPSRGTKLSS